MPDPGEVDGNAGYGYSLGRETNAAVKAANDLLAAGDSVHVATEDSRDGAAGTFIIEAGDGTADRVAAMARDLGIDFQGLRSEPAAEKAALSRPRVGLYKSYVASMDEGWTRWVLEDHGFDVVSLEDGDMRRGDFSSLDAIILPHPDGRVYFKDDVQEMLTGHSPGSMPDEYTGRDGPGRCAGARSIRQEWRHYCRIRRRRRFRTGDIRSAGERRRRCRIAGEFLHPGIAHSCQRRYQRSTRLGE